MQLGEPRSFSVLWLHTPSVCPWGAVLFSAGVLQEQGMEIKTDRLHAAPFLAAAWGAEGWKASSLPSWSICAALQGWKLALEEGGEKYVSGLVLHSSAPILSSNKLSRRGSDKSRACRAVGLRY